MSDSGERARRVVVITGASAGVGRAAARAFAERGDDVALLARGADGLEAARKEVEERGARALAIPTDVADAAQVEAAAGRVESELGPIDVWVNNAMTTVFSPFVEIEPEDYKRVTEVTYLGFVYGTQAALKRMRSRDRGVIIQVGSALAYRGIPLQSAYCGAKHAIVGFTESVLTELMNAGSGIRVSMVHMPALNTPQFEWSKSNVPFHPQPVPPIFQPEVAADAIVAAADSPRREILVGSNTPLVVWGNKLVPELADWYLARTGFESQMTDEVIDVNRPNNLYEPVPGDRGAHGSFDEQAREHGLRSRSSVLPFLLVGAAALVGVLSGLATE